MHPNAAQQKTLEKLDELAQGQARLDAKLDRILVEIEARPKPEVDPSPAPASRPRKAGA